MMYHYTKSQAMRVHSLQQQTKIHEATADLTSSKNFVDLNRNARGGGIDINQYQKPLKNLK